MLKSSRAGGTLCGPWRRDELESSPRDAGTQDCGAKPPRSPRSGIAKAGIEHLGFLPTQLVFRTRALG